MVDTTTYLSAGVAFIALSIIFLVAFIEGQRDPANILPTPSIPVSDGVLTSFASTTIHGTVDEVFDVLLNYRDYSWSTDSKYTWKETTADGVPMVGSPGTLKLTVEDFTVRMLDLQLTLLDRENKRIAEKTTLYPRWLLKTERMQEVVPIEGHKKICEYRTWMTHVGIAAYFLILIAKEELEDNQKRCAEDLKTYVENGKR